MEGILQETTLFIEEREKSLARLSSFEPIDENPPELELLEVVDGDSRAAGAWMVGESLSGEFVDDRKDTWVLASFLLTDWSLASGDRKKVEI